MREILFRGKRKLDGVWIYGDLLHNNNCVKIRENETDIDHIAKSFEVDPDTVGQFTGMYDKREYPIFEGDIMSSEWGYCVRYEEDCFTILRGGVPLRHCASRLDILGNVYDNPELLGGGGDE